MNSTKELNNWDQEQKKNLHKQYPLNQKKKKKKEFQNSIVEFRWLNRSQDKVVKGETKSSSQQIHERKSSEHKI